MIDLNQFKIDQIGIGEDCYQEGKLLRRLEITIDFSEWKKEIFSIQHAGQGIYNDDACFYFSDQEIGLEHKHEACARWDQKSRVAVKLTSNFENDLNELAKIVRDDFKSFIDYEMDAVRKECAVDDEDLRYFQDQLDRLNKELSWIK